MKRPRRILFLISLTLVLTAALASCQSTPTTAVLPTSSTASVGTSAIPGTAEALCTTATPPSTTATPITETPTVEVTLPAHTPPTASTPHYDLSYDENGAYLQIKTETTVATSDLGGMVAAPSLYFDTAAEMREKMITGDLSEEQVFELNRFYKDPETGKITIVNFNQLYELKLADNGYSRVRLSKAEYYFKAVLEKTLSGAAFVITPEEYAKRINAIQSYHIDTKNWTVWETTTEAERNAVVVTGEAVGFGEKRGFKHVVYSVENEKGLYHIHEYYELYNPMAASTSETVPYMIVVYYRDASGVCAKFVWYSKNPTVETRPSLETLTSFWFEPLATNGSSDTVIK